jgi:Holliday junction resolvase
MAQEKKIESQIKGHLRWIGAYVVKHHGSRFSQAGVPDLLVCYKGRFIGIEVKAPDGKPSELQLHHIEQIKKAGGIGFITDNLKETRDKLNAI